jgi:hypothetical protein
LEVPTPKVEREWLLGLSWLGDVNKPAAMGNMAL